MKSRHVNLVAILSLSMACTAIAVSTAVAAPPQNLAPKAMTSATSEHNAHYQAKFAVDGKIPPAGSGSADLDAAWCVLKAKSGDQADFTLQWQQPVDLSEIIYFGRTAWFMNECWKDYEVYLDDAGQPAAKGSLKMVHGPQRIKLAKTKAGKITIKFLNSHGGLNPGAAEIMVFSQSPSKKDLAQLTKGSGYAALPQVDEVDRDKLRALITELIKAHGPAYHEGPEHLARLDKMADESDELAQLQREVLLFDVDKLLVIKRHEITASHVYTYHYEGQHNGGGLYVVSPHDLDAQPVELVASPDGQILDCDLSHDGKVVLFSWRRGMGQGYHLWTVNVDGTGLKQLTDGEWHDYNGCWLPDGDVAFLTTRYAPVRLLLARPGGHRAPHVAQRLGCPPSVGQLSERFHALRAG